MTANQILSGVIGRAILRCFNDIAMPVSGSFCVRADRIDIHMDASGESYAITLAPADVEPAGDTDMDFSIQGYPAPTKLENHFDLLYLCLHALAGNDEVRKSITDLTTDGDGKDCEACFALEGEYYFLKIRPIAGNPSA